MELDEEIKTENEHQDNINNENNSFAENENFIDETTNDIEKLSPNEESYFEQDENVASKDDSTENQPAGETINLTKKKYKFYTDGYIFSFLIIFFAVFASFIFTFNYLFHPIKVVGKSMQPTINNNVYYQDDDDDTHCDIVYYMQAEHYNNNDIVIVMNNDNKYIPKTGGKEVTSVIKRVIATPKQKVRFYLTDKEVNQNNISNVKYYYNIEVYEKDENGEYVNIDLDQSYLDESKEMFFTSQELYYFSRSENSAFRTFYNIFSEVAFMSEYYYEVDENSYFIMGDNRNDSTDSRFFGAVLYDDIAGSVRILVKYGSNLIIAIWKNLKNEI